MPTDPPQDHRQSPFDVSTTRVRPSWARPPTKPGSLAVETVHGDNVTRLRNRRWTGDEEFADEKTVKRQKTAYAPRRSRVLHDESMTVDLTGDDQAQEIAARPQTVEAQDLTGSPRPTASSPQRLSGNSQPSSRPGLSRKSSKPQPSIAPEFGKLTEFSSVEHRTNPRKRGALGTWQSAPPSRSLQEDSTQVTGPATNSGINRFTLPTDDSTPRFRRRHLNGGSSEQYAAAFKGNMAEDCDDDDSLPFEPAQPGDRECSKQMEIELNAKLKRQTNAYSRANAKHRASMTSEDELAGSNSRYTVGRPNSTKMSETKRANASVDQPEREIRRQRDSETSVDKDFRTRRAPRFLSKDDIQPTTFTVARVIPSPRSDRPSQGDRSGWDVQVFSSNLIETRNRRTNLQMGRKFCTVPGQEQRLNAVDLTKIDKCYTSGKLVVLLGDHVAWAVLRFFEIPERSGFTGQLKSSHPHITAGELESPEAVEGLFYKILRERGARLKPSSPNLRATRRADPVLEIIESPVNGLRSATSVGGRMKDQAGGGDASVRLISQLTTSDKSHDEVRLPSRAEFKQPRRLRSGGSIPADDSNTTFSFADDGKVRNVEGSGLRRSDRSSKRTTSRYFYAIDDPVVQQLVSEEDRYSRKVGLGDPWEFSLTYPLVGKDRATVEFLDLERLDDGEYLNDNLIEFYLRWARQQQLDAGTYRESQVHFFNTFFYEKLAGGRTRIDYKAVKSWTRKVDIFDIDFVVVPVNESAHWYVCIICNLPNLKRESEVTDLTKDDELEHSPELTTPKVEDWVVQLQAAADTKPKRSSSGSATETQPDQITEPSGQVTQEPSDMLSSTTNEPHDMLDIAKDNDSSPGLADFEASQNAISLIRNDGVFKNAKVGTPKSSRARRRRSGPTPRKYDPRTTIIITLDSLGLTHAKTTSNLKDYIIAEAAAKHGLDVQKEDIKGMNVTRGIPQQQNFCDCGVFLLGYVHKFLADPRAFVTKILSNEMDEEQDWPDMNPKTLRANVRETIQKTYLDQLPERQKMKKRRKGQSKEQSIVGVSANTKQPPPEQASNAALVASTRRSSSLQAPARAQVEANSEDTDLDMGHVQPQPERATTSVLPDNASTPSSIVSKQTMDRTDAVSQSSTSHQILDLAEEPSEDVMLLDVSNAQATKESRDIDDDEMLMWPPGRSVQTAREPTVGTRFTTSSKRSREAAMEIDEVPDSQENLESTSTDTKIDRLRDNMQLLKETKFPPFPGFRDQASGTRSSTTSKLLFRR